ncbi:YHYH protein [Winogradskyella sp.]|uniref:YHYH protein n=1 Tax=Winogradskyella sp. TaxID=1883156 RepID=UPI0026283588|nr:YHYH protein [Winogradskyella sp.]
MFMNQYPIFGLLALLSLNCNSQKAKYTHNHDGTSHVHETTLETNNYFGEYTLNRETYGTKTVVKIKGNQRIMTTNALPDHETGDFPNQGNPNAISSQNKTYAFPLYPKYIGKAKWVREPGVALNGVKFEPGTAEVVICDTGENYRVEALQDVIDLGLDFNHAHVQPTGAYHYHGTPTSVIENFDSGEDLVHIGFAHDGFPMYYSKSGKYKSSYKAVSGSREGEDCTYENPTQRMQISVEGHHDGTFTSDFEYVEGYGDLDECNGITVDGHYMYLVTREFPYVSRCLMGEYKEERRPQYRSMNMDNRARRGRRYTPSFSELLEKMDKDNDKRISKNEAQGPLHDFFDRVDANKDGYLTEEEVKNALQHRNQRSARRG